MTYSSSPQICSLLVRACLGIGLWIGLPEDQLAAIEPIKLPTPWSMDLHGRYTLTGLINSDAPSSNRNNIDLRRARVTGNLRYGERTTLKASADFPNEDIKLREFQLTYSNDALVFDIGRMLEPLGLSSAESSNGLPLVERSMIANLERNFGLGLKLSAVSEEYGTLTGALFSPLLNGTGLSYTNDDDALDLRYTIAKNPTDETTLHFGISSSLRRPNRKNWNYGLRPESRLISGSEINSAPLSEIKRTRLIGLEFAAQIDSLLVQSEYMNATYDSERSIDPTLQGAYVRASWVLTGEARGYDPVLGAFDRIQPDSDLTAGGIGAIELAGRYSWVELQDRLEQGDRASIWTAGFNWYPIERLQAGINLHWIHHESRNPKSSERIVQFRIHWFF